VLVAKAKEAEKNYREAEKAYERANDYENIIRLNLEFLDNPEKAENKLFKNSMIYNQQPQEPTRNVGEVRPLEVPHGYAINAQIYR
jgi:hypothetical protein